MSTAVMGGICGTAVMRAADAMLRSMGGQEISMLIPLGATPGDVAGQLGLADPGVEEVKISPVVTRNLPTQNNGPRRRVEFLVPGSGIAMVLSSHDFASAEQLIDATLGIVYEGELFHIEGFSAEYFGASAYLYRVVGVE
jgi:hypothetical protein